MRERTVKLYSVFAGLITQYIDYKDNMGCKTIVMEYILKRFDKFAFERKETNVGITKELSDAWCYKLPGESEENRYYRIVVMRGFSSFLQIIGYDSHIPKLPKQQLNFTPYIYSSDEIKRILIECDRINSYHTTLNSIRFAMPCLIRTLYGTGMRIGELCALRLRDIDVDNKVINVCATMQRVPFLATNEIQDLTDVEILRKANDSIVCVGPPKTSGSYREIPIYGFILDYYKHAKKMFCPDYFISTLSQNFIEPRNFRTRYRDVIISKVGLSRCLKLHACRHTFATNLITNGVDFRTTAELLGHSDVSTTLNIYSHATDDSKRKAISKVYNKIRRR